MNEEYRNQYYQIEAQKYLQEKLGNSVWIQVCGHKKINKSEAGFWCGFWKDEELDTLEHEFDSVLSHLKTSCVS